MAAEILDDPVFTGLFHVVDENGRHFLPRLLSYEALAENCSVLIIDDNPDMEFPWANYTFYVEESLARDRTVIAIFGTEESSISPTFLSGLLEATQRVVYFKDSWARLVKVFIVLGGAHFDWHNSLSSKKFLLKVITDRMKDD